jgi:hypothetical protein
MKGGWDGIEEIWRLSQGLKDYPYPEGRYKVLGVSRQRSIAWNQALRLNRDITNVGSSWFITVLR